MNAFFTRTSIISIDSGTTLNTSQAGNGTTIGSTVYSFLSGTNTPLTTGSFLKIEMNGAFDATASHTGGGGTSSIAVQMGRSGTSFSADILANTGVVNSQASSATNFDNNNTQQFTFYHDISPDDVSSGLDLIIKLTATASQTSLSASYGNRQTVFQVIQ